MHLLLRIIAGAAALYLTVLLGQHWHLGLSVAPGLAGIEATAIAAFVLGVANAVVRPLVMLLALPVTCATFGLFGLVVNALLFWAVGQGVPGFHVRGVEAALFGSVVMGVVSGVLNFLVVRSGERGRR